MMIVCISLQFFFLWGGRGVVVKNLREVFFLRGGGGGGGGLPTHNKCQDGCIGPPCTCSFLSLGF